MKRVPTDIVEIENVFIKMSDGIELAARLFLPKSYLEKACPAVLEYLPYRKRDLMRSRDETLHRYFAAQGIAGIRVDVRGSGDSEGFLEDEYSEQEITDALQVIRWIAQQPWCSGNVGMMGISWGGFNSLQVAAKNPPELKAIMTLCASDDRYADDAHYMGGCLLNENMQWGSILTMYGAYPPDPLIVGEKWKSMWDERLTKLAPFPIRWMEHPARDNFWKQGSICENYSDIKIPVYAIGGWADGYSNSVFRTLENLQVPRKGLIGPWAHNFPHDGIPGPSIGFLQEATQWWKHWLMGEKTSIMDGPMLRVWMQESVPPLPYYHEWPGRWVSEESCPSLQENCSLWQLDVGSLAPMNDERSDSSVVLSFSSPETTGIRGGEWCGFGIEGEMPRDQRPDDGGSLCFDSGPFKKVTEFLGAPELELTLEVDKEVGLLAARICDIAPDGSSLRVSYGVLNLNHYLSHEKPIKLTPGKKFKIKLKLNDFAHSFPKDHRLRLSLSTNYWPIVWPAPEKVQIKLFTGSSLLKMPTRKPEKSDEKLVPFLSPEAAVGSRAKKLIHLPMKRSIRIDLTTHETVYTLKSDGGELGGASRAYIEEIDLELGYKMLKRYRITEGHPSSSQTEMFQRSSFYRPGYNIQITCVSKLLTTATHFIFSCNLSAFENKRLVKKRRWRKKIPRDLF